jgi:hypothetical protein
MSRPGELALLALSHNGWEIERAGDALLDAAALLRQIEREVADVREVDERAPDARQLVERLVGLDE